MKKLFLFLLLASCTKPDSTTPLSRCNDYCSEFQNVSALDANMDVCICKTDSGVRNFTAICVLSTNQTAECAIQGLALCEELTVQYPTDTFCDQLEEHYGTGKQVQ